MKVFLCFGRLNGYQSRKRKDSGWPYTAWLHVASRGPHVGWLYVAAVTWVLCGLTSRVACRGLHVPWPHAAPRGLVVKSHRVVLTLAPRGLTWFFLGPGPTWPFQGLHTASPSPTCPHVVAPHGPHVALHAYHTWALRGSYAASSAPT